MGDKFDIAELEGWIRDLVDEVVDEVGAPGRLVGESSRWLASGTRRENLKAVACAAVLQGVFPGAPIRRQSELWKAAEIKKAHGAGFLAEDVTIVEQVNYRLTRRLMERGLLPRRGHLYSGIAHAPRPRGAKVPGRLRAYDRKAGGKVDGWAKVNLFIGGIDFPDAKTIRKRPFAHRLRSAALVRLGDERRLRSVRRRWQRLFHGHPDHGYAYQAIGLAAEVQEDIGAAGDDPRDYVVVLGAGRLEDQQGAIGLAGGGQELPGDALGFVAPQVRDRLLPGTVAVAACSGAVDSPHHDGADGGAPDWALRVRHGAVGIPAAVGLKVLTMGHPTAAANVIPLAAGDGWDVSVFQGDVLVDGRATGWGLLLFRVFEEDEDGIDGANAVVYPYLCSLDMASGPHPDMRGALEMIVEALLPLHAPGPDSAAFELCRSNSFRLPLALMTLNGHSADIQDQLEGVRDLVNIGRLAAFFGGSDGDGRALVIA